MGWWGFEEGMSTWCSPQCWLAPQVSKCCERVKESGLFSLPEKTLKVSNPLDRIIPRGAGSPPGVSILYVLYTLYRVYPCSPQSSRFLPSSPSAQQRVALPNPPSCYLEKMQVWRKHRNKKYLKVYIWTYHRLNVWLSSSGSWRLRWAMEALKLVGGARIYHSHFHQINHFCFVKIPVWFSRGS